jgi:PAS domain S-box-containing protein
VTRDGVPREAGSAVRDDEAARPAGDVDVTPADATDSAPAGGSGGSPANGPGRAGAARLSLPITSLDLGGDAVFVTDGDGIIVDVNEAFVRVTGYAREEAIGQSPRLLSSGFQDDSFYEGLWDTITAGRVWEGELVDRRRDGQLRTHHVTITPVRDGTGRITNYVAVERDVSDELARAGGSTHSGLVHTDATGGCIYADLDAARMFDEDPTSLLGSGLRAALAPEDADALVETVGMAVESGRDFRLAVRTEAGRWIELVVAPLTLASGSVIGARCALEDVTERMSVEHELARRSALVTSVLDALDDPVAVVGTEGSVLVTNRAWRLAGEEEGGLLASLRVGADARAAVDEAAGGGDPPAVQLREDLRNVLSGRARGRRHATGFTVHPLAWEEGGAVLRYRPTSTG